MQVANFGAKHGGEWAPSRRNPGSLFVCSKQKAATWENGRGARSLYRDQLRVRALQVKAAGCPAMALCENLKAALMA
jgi:hypothetical protein